MEKLIEKLLETPGIEEAIMRASIEKAREGDIRALKFILAAYEREKAPKEITITLKEKE